MNVADVLDDAFARIGDVARSVVDGLTPQELNARVDGSANSIAWLLWHAARVQDAQVAEVAGTEQRWTANDWVGRFDLALEAGDTGYGHSSEEVAEVRIEDGELLLGYLDDVLAATATIVAGLSEADLDRVVDRDWDPPVTLGVRLVSVLDDDLQHVGQAAFVKGMLGRR